MVDEPDNFVLEHLRRICPARDGLREDVRDPNPRMTRVAPGLGNGGATTGLGSVRTGPAPVATRVHHSDRGKAAVGCQKSPDARLDTMDARPDRLTTFFGDSFKRMDERFACMDRRLERTERRLDLAPVD